VSAAVSDRRSAIEVLRAARKRIEDPKRWTRGAFARTKDGVLLVDPTAPDAVCWCAHGAIEAEAKARALGTFPATALVEEAGGGHVFQINDGSLPAGYSERHPRKAPARHRLVLATFDKAIELAEAQG
jgi:hypothetical protein